jgi:hypothetical protein
MATSLRDGGVDTVDMIADMLVDPVQLLLQLLGAESHSSQYADTTRLANCHHHITAVGEGENRGLDAQLFAEFSLHAVTPVVVVPLPFTGKPMNTIVEDARQCGNDNNGRNDRQKRTPGNLERSRG